MHADIINFWFNEIEPKHWWQKDLEFDALIETRFGSLHQQASASELDSWRSSALGCLAEVIVLDQFSRNIYRGQAASFAQDTLALSLAQHAIEKGFDQQLEPMQRSFLYMPFMHSESALIHEQSIALFEALGDDLMLGFAKKHKAIIDQFGRYPHRNDIFKRESTAAEVAFLSQPDSSF